MTQQKSQNRIVIDYNGIEELILITIRENDTSVDFGPMEIGFPCVEPINKTIDELMIEKLRSDFINKEGFVVKFEDGTRVKIKYEEYFRLHKIMTGWNEHNIWEMLKNNEEICLDNVPDEFFNFITITKNKIMQNYKMLESSMQNTYNQILSGNIQSRKEFAVEALKHKYSSALFKLYEKRDYSHLIWNLIEPKSTIKAFESYQPIVEVESV